MLPSSSIFNPTTTTATVLLVLLVNLLIILITFASSNNNFINIFVSASSSSSLPPHFSTCVGDTACECLDPSQNPFSGKKFTRLVMGTTAATSFVVGSSSFVAEYSSVSKAALFYYSNLPTSSSSSSTFSSIAVPGSRFIVEFVCTRYSISAASPEKDKFPASADETNVYRISTQSYESWYGGSLPAPPQSVSVVGFDFVGIRQLSTTEIAPFSESGASSSISAYSPWFLLRAHDCQYTLLSQYPTSGHGSACRDLIQGFPNNVLTLLNLTGFNLLLLGGGTAAASSSSSSSSIRTTYNVELKQPGRSIDQEFFETQKSYDENYTECITVRFRFRNIPSYFSNIFTHLPQDFFSSRILLNNDDYLIATGGKRTRSSCLGTFQIDPQSLSGGAQTDDSSEPVFPIWGIILVVVAILVIAGGVAAVVIFQIPCFGICDPEKDGDKNTKNFEFSTYKEEVLDGDGGKREGMTALEMHGLASTTSRRGGARKNKKHNNNTTRKNAQSIAAALQKSKTARKSADDDDAGLGSKLLATPRTIGNGNDDDDEEMTTRNQRREQRTSTPPRSLRDFNKRANMTMMKPSALSEHQLEEEDEQNRDPFAALDNVIREQKHDFAKSNSYSHLNTTTTGNTTYDEHHHNNAGAITPMKRKPPTNEDEDEQWEKDFKKYQDRQKRTMVVANPDRLVDSRSSSPLVIELPPMLRSLSPEQQRQYVLEAIIKSRDNSRSGSQVNNNNNNNNNNSRSNSISMPSGGGRSSSSLRNSRSNSNNTNNFLSSSSSAPVERSGSSSGGSLAASASTPTKRKSAVQFLDTDDDDVVDEKDRGESGYNSSSSTGNNNNNSRKGRVIQVRGLSSNADDVLEFVDDLDDENELKLNFGGIATTMAARNTAEMGKKKIILDDDDDGGDLNDHHKVVIRPSSSSSSTSRSRNVGRTVANPLSQVTSAPAFSSLNNAGRSGSSTTTSNVYDQRFDML